MRQTAQSVVDIERQWLTDYESYARDLLFIQPMPDPNNPELMGSQLKTLKFNGPQMVLDRIFRMTKDAGRPVRFIILKARREGVSTYISGRNYWMTTTRFNRYSLMVAHEPEATEFLFQMHKRFYTHNPVWKPKITYNNKRLLNFDTADGRGLGSAIRVATAGKEDIGSAQGCHYLHLSEMAKYPEHIVEPLMTSVMQTIPRSLDTEVVIESTAKGIGGEFYDRYWDARYRAEVVLVDGKPEVKFNVNEDADETNIWTSIFLPWYVFELYEMDPPPGFERDEEEQELSDTYGLTDRQLSWRRWCIANNCNGMVEIFRQEYPSNPEEAFISSGSTVFDMQQVIRMIEQAPDPVARYTISLDSGQFISDKNGELRVWEEPVPGELYVIGGDVSEGIDRNVMGRVADWSVASVFKASTGVQVAEWHGKIDPDMFGIVMAHIGERYNRAWLVPERNNHGNSTVMKLVDLRYPRIYVERVPEPPNRIRKRFGWLTTRGNKSDLVNNMLAEMRDGTAGILSKELLEEMKSFKKDGDKYEAEVGRFDDRIMAAMIAKFTLPRLKPRGDSRETFDSPSNREHTAPPVGAWMV